MDEPGNQTYDLSETIGILAIVVISAYLILSAIAIAGVLVAIWPGQADLVLPVIGRVADDAEGDVRLILIVAFAGALGSYVHAATSFVTYVGNRKFVRSWVLWYVLRPFIGMALALIVYFTVRGGLFSLSAEVVDINPYGAAALAGGVGMFSKEATDKLGEIFKEIFRTSQQVPRDDPLGEDEEGAEQADE